MAHGRGDCDPDEEFLDRLAKKTSFYDQPSAPPETLNLPSASLDGLADVQVEEHELEKEGPYLLQVVAPPQDPEAAAAEKARRAEVEKREARFASLFDGRSSGGAEQTGVPENLKFSQLSRSSAPQPLPDVGTKAASAEEEALRAEDEARRAAWAELNAIRAAETEAGARYKRAYAQFVATWGHRGAELRE
ncbi:expressed protein [Chlorella variabilis]|uniref:Expressed protein n=1 Tax=Chlorella variabilis TaxID=554065 RepID=E1ZKQ1_CHLVA|nr:expressed protein [Chlorella variabilis]EFN53420.1 expressed protein [Chlorella variabilis]|eukprot:XP_005845522.1 expressed protein [Chlorella variabilis]